MLYYLKFSLGIIRFDMTSFSDVKVQLEMLVHSNIARGTTDPEIDSVTWI